MEAVRAMTDGLGLYNELQDAMDDLDRVIAEHADLGRELTTTECRYYRVKTLRSYELMEQGYSATAVAMLIKGEPRVNDAMSAYHAAELSLKNAAEAIQAQKRRVDILREEMSREWASAGKR